MIVTASQRALIYLKKVDREGASCFDVGGAVWPDRTGRIASASGGGDYAAQMLLGRLRKAGLVEYAPSEGSTQWRLSSKGRDEAAILRALPNTETTRSPSRPPRASGNEACVCGCAIEAHGGDPEYPGSTSCTECECIAYEADMESA